MPVFCESSRYGEGVWGEDAGEGEEPVMFRSVDFGDSSVCFTMVILAERSQQEEYEEKMREKSEEPVIFRWVNFGAIRAFVSRSLYDRTESV